MWRSDAARTASTPERLPDEIHPQWVRQLPPYQLAWPNESRLHFDASYAPVVAGKLLFIGSAADGSVRAYSTETGEERWRFYTEGPVRFAPAAWGGKVYAASDDGFLYCLHADSGKLAWKVRGAPADRPDYRHLGNNRLISYWPARGGPVVAEGVVYFAAGIWPTLGVFVLAVDAESGRVRWRNDDSHYLSQVRIDHNELAEAGLSPQGYLLVSGDKLLVPNGRSMPARLDRATGRLLYYVQGYRNGDCRVTTMGKVAFVGETGVMNVEDGREMGSRWPMARTEAPIRPYKTTPACSASSVLDAGIVYGADKGVFYAHDLTRAAATPPEREAPAGPWPLPARWNLPEIWKLSPGVAGGAAHVLLKAGNRVYGHVGKTLVALEVPDTGGQPRLAWQQPVDGTPSSMAAASGRLFVVTAEGALHCFGEKKAAPRMHALQASGLPEAQGEASKAVSQVLEQAGVTEGVCLVLGLRDGRMVEELLRGSKLRVIAVDGDARKVDALRDRLAATGVYGTRVEVFTGEPLSFRFPPYLASLILTEHAELTGFRAEAHAAALFRTLRPYGGVACLALSATQMDAAGKAIRAASIPNARLERVASLLLLRREGALPGAAYWTHESADAARSYFSKDQLVRAPLGVLWYGDGEGYGFFKSKDYGVGVKPQVVGGCLVALQLHTNELHAIDVYTGRTLWKRKVEHFTRYASLEDAVYVAAGDQCLVLDPATGEPMRTFTYRAEGIPQPFVSDVRVADDVIVIATAARKSRAIERGLWDGTLLVALDRKSGKQLWARAAGDRFNLHALAIGGGLVFAIDSRAAASASFDPPRNETGGASTATLLALDARTGRERWSVAREGKYRTYDADGWLPMRTYDDWLAYSEETGFLVAGRNDQCAAFVAETGRDVWSKTIRGGQPLILRGDRFINQAGHVYALRTGDLVSDRPLFVRGGCNYAVAGQRLLFVRDRTVSYVDLESGHKYYLRNIRSGCSNSLIAADGLLNAPCFSVQCVCNYSIQTSFAMVHMPEVAAWEGADPVVMVEKAGGQ